MVAESRPRGGGSAGAAAREPRTARQDAQRSAPAPTWPPPGVTVQWSGKGWHAHVVVAEDGEGWAVEMRRDGDEDPVLVSPWTMGRNKKDPKPLNEADFGALVKAARDFLARAEAQARAATRKSMQLVLGDGTAVKATFELIGDEDDPQGRLRVVDGAGVVVVEDEVEPSFAFSRLSIEAWIRRSGGSR